MLNRPKFPHWYSDSKMEGKRCREGKLDFKGQRGECWRTESRR